MKVEGRVPLGPDGANQQIFRSEYQAGTGWSHPLGLSDNITLDGENASDAQVVMGEGRALIVWQQGDGADVQIFKSEYGFGGQGWNTPSSLSDNISPDGQSALVPQVAMDSDGNALIVWYQFSGSTHQIYKSEYRGGVWTHPAGLSDFISPDGQDTFAPQAAMNDRGEALIVWYESDGSTSQVFMAEYRDGTWNYPSGLSDNISPNGQAAHTPQVAMDNLGNALIGWQQAVSGVVDTNIFRSTYQ